MFVEHFIVFNLNFRQNKPIKFSSILTKILTKKTEISKTNGFIGPSVDSTQLKNSLCICVCMHIICVHHFYRKLTECFGHFEVKNEKRKNNNIAVNKYFVQLHVKIVMGKMFKSNFRKSQPNASSIITDEIQMDKWSCKLNIL